MSAGRQTTLPRGCRCRGVATGGPDQLTGRKSLGRVIAARKSDRRMNGHTSKSPVVRNCCVQSRAATPSVIRLTRFSGQVLRRRGTGHSVRSSPCRNRTQRTTCLRTRVGNRSWPVSRYSRRSLYRNQAASRSTLPRGRRLSSYWSSSSSFVIRPAANCVALLQRLDAMEGRPCLVGTVSARATCAAAPDCPDDGTTIVARRRPALGVPLSTSSSHSLNRRPSRRYAGGGGGPCSRGRPEQAAHA